MAAKLAGEAVARVTLGAHDQATMFALFREHYDGATQALFQRDLSNKDWVVLVRDECGQVQGFTTFTLYQSCVAGQALGVVYSGDTIQRPDYWGNPELIRCWMKTVLAQTAGLPQPVYWFLISSGYKTYRMLPVFAKEFYPRYDRPTPVAEQAIVDHIAADRFGAEYDAARGIVRFAHGATPLKPGVADITAEKLADPHIAYFVERNPGHLQGDELVCLAQICYDNLTPAARWLAR